MEQFLGYFRDLFDDTHPISVTADTKFRDLVAWDSIMALSLVGMIDEEYDVSFTSDDMKACITVEDIYKRIESKK